MDRSQYLPAISRRTLLAGAGAGVLAGLGSMVSRSSWAGHGAEKGRDTISSAQALTRLEAGNERYAQGVPETWDFSVASAAQTQAKTPIAAILACADSPVPPEVLFDQGRGALFTVRDAGNVVSDYALASMEFAVVNLGVPLIFVLGHSGCDTVATALGAVRARKELPGRLPELVKAIEPAIIAAHGRHPGDFLAASIEENVQLGMKRLKSQSKIIAEAAGTGALGIKGGVYDFTEGRVRRL